MARVWRLVVLLGVAEPRCQQAESEEEAEGCRAGRGSRAVELENATDDHRQPVGWLVECAWFFPFRAKLSSPDNWVLALATRCQHRWLVGCEEQKTRRILQVLWVVIEVAYVEDLRVSSWLAGVLLMCCAVCATWYYSMCNNMR